MWMDILFPTNFKNTFPRIKVSDNKLEWLPIFEQSLLPSTKIQIM